MLKQVLLILSLVLVLGSNSIVRAAPLDNPAAGTEAVQTATVRVDGVALFPVRGIAAHPARDRAAAITGRIIALADDPAVKIGTIVPVESDHSTDIMAGDRFIMSIFDVDAELDKVPRQVLAKAYVTRIRATVEAYRRDRGSRSILLAASTALGATLGLVALILLVRGGFRRLIALVEERFTARIRELQAKSHDIVRTEWIWAIFKGVLRTARIIIVLLIGLLYIDLVLSAGVKDHSPGRRLHFINHCFYPIFNRERVGIIQLCIQAQDQYARDWYIFGMPVQVRVSARHAGNAPQRGDMRPACFVDYKYQRSEHPDDHSFQHIDQQHTRQRQHAKPELDPRGLAEPVHLARGDDMP